MASAPTDNTTCFKSCELSNTGQALIRTFEGYSPYIYKDSAGLDTIGYGHLVLKHEKFVQPLLPEDANTLLLKDTINAVSAVNKNVNVRLKQTQADPLISFTYNVGGTALKNSTLLKKVNAEKHEEVPPQFLRWVKAGGKFVQGLLNRRTAEAELYKR